MLLRRVLVSLSLTAFFVLLSHAQERTGDVQVRVSYANGVACNQQLRLDLVSSSGAVNLSAYTNSDCMAAFNDVAVGDYHVVVSGDGVQTTDGPTFPVDDRKVGQYQFVSVQRDNKTSAAAGRATISAAALKIPRDAQKNFDKASELIAKENWPKAKEKLEKALTIYPEYAEAYNNLGVVLGRMGDRAAERENLGKAVELNPHFSEAYVNLAKLSIKLRELPAAENYLNRAVATGATDSGTLTLLANVELLNKQYEQAVTTCLTLHNGPPAPHMFCHYISAHALESENRMDGARQQLQLFLTEESKGPRADQVRKELAGLETR